MRNLNEMLGEIWRSGIGSDKSQKKVLKGIIEEVIDEILNHPEMIYVDPDTDNEAVYDYEAFEEFKKQIK